MNFNSDGGLLTYEHNGRKHCLGYLMNFKEHGVHDASLGRVDVTPEQANTHNAVYDKMMVEGLDKNCQIGQGGDFYINYEHNQVRTWLGTVLGTLGRHSKTVFTFTRNNMEFRGRIRKDDDSVFFKRIA